MQKIDLALLVSVACVALGVVLFFFHWKFWGGFLCGFSCCLVLFGTIGKWQARKAAEHIDRIINATKQ